MSTESKSGKNRIDGHFAPRLLEMLRSPAYRALSRAAHQVLARLELELGPHDTKNGKLIVTFAQFEEYGLHRKAIGPAIRELVSLGFLEVVEQGRGGNAIWRRPSKYRLTYRKTNNSVPTHEWRSITEEAADLFASEARRPGKHFPGPESVPTPGPETAPENTCFPGPESVPDTPHFPGPESVPLSRSYPFSCEGREGSATPDEPKPAPFPSPTAPEPVPTAAVFGDFERMLRDNQLQLDRIRERLDPRQPAAVVTAKGGRSPGVITAAYNRELGPDNTPLQALYPMVYSA